MDAEKRFLLALLFVILASINLVGTLQASHVKINLDTIARIESGWNPRAFNYRTKATGLFQITPICLQDWNDQNPENQYRLPHLWNARVNREIADWYFHVRLPQILRMMEIPVTEETLLFAYNWGPGNVRKAYRPSIGENVPQIPKETLNYVRKYRALNGSSQ